jgi:hypothetical protein
MPALCAEILNPKFEIRNKFKFSKSKTQNATCLEFGILNLDIVSNFDIRISDFRAKHGF